MSRPCELDAVEARRLIGTKSLSPVELLDSCLEQIDAVNPAVNAMVTVAADRARQEARTAADAVAAGEPLGPLHGLPVAVKDIQLTEGITTTFGSEDFASFVPRADAGIVARMRRAGAIVLGKTNIPEFSIGANTVNRLFGATGNPFDPSRTCGGSSGGSAVALACELVPLATGSDHGGSLRIPACYSGVVGHRSSPGVVPFEERTLTQTFYSVQGPMARTVADAALLQSVIAGRGLETRRDPMVFPLDAGAFARLAPLDLSDLRVAVSADLGGVLVSESVRRTFAERIERMAGAFARCEQVGPETLDLTRAPEVDWALRQDVFVAQYARQADRWDDGFNPNIRETYDAARRTEMVDIAKARRLQLDLYQHANALFDRFDLLLCPGVSVSPFPWTQLNPTEIDGRPVSNYMAWLNLTAAITIIGHPVTALPCGFDEASMPFGMQVIGPMYGDVTVLRAALALEALFAADPVLRRPRPDFVALRAAGPIPRPAP
ncbi:MAG: amidase [Acidimicrobiales bacterium]|nr:amidase [Acidimicrobiales bacterium]